MFVTEELLALSHMYNACLGDFHSFPCMLLLSNSRGLPGLSGGLGNQSDVVWFCYRR